jgi:hypothetical protein
MKWLNFAVGMVLGAVLVEALEWSKHLRQKSAQAPANQLPVHVPGQASAAWHEQAEPMSAGYLHIVN